MDPNDTPAPAGTVAVAPTTDRGAIDALAAILDDPVEPDTEEGEAHADEDAEGADEVAEGIDASEDSGEKTEASKDGTQPTGGRFVEHAARIALPDGTTTTVGELVHGYLRQSDYTRKTQETADIRRTVESERERVSQTTQQLQTQLSRMAAMLDQWKPQPPQNADDYVGWVTYQQQEKAWKDWQGSLDTEAQNLQAQQVQAIQAGLARESELLFQKFPAMRDPAKRQTFLDEASRFLGERYGIDPEAVASISNHQQILIIRDLMRADRLSAKAPEVKDKIQGKPKMVRGGRRGGDPSQDGKRARIERLRETGSRADGVRSLMDLDL